MTAWRNWLMETELAGSAAKDLIESIYHKDWLASDVCKVTPKDREAAWAIYTELRTRITTEPLHYRSGDEATALKSVADLFAMTRDTFHKHGSVCRNCAIFVTGMLNGILRPFTAKGRS